MFLSISLSIGVFASLLMFCGDMMLYFTTGKYESDGTLQPVIAIMQKISDWRLKLGGMLGPIAAFFYCIGFSHIIVSTNEKYQCFACIIFLLCCLGIIIGGAFHSHCSYLGLIRKSDQNTDMEKVIGNIKLLSGVSFAFMGFALFLLVVIIMLGETRYPRWSAIMSPGILYFLKPLWKRVPQPFRIILYGGWDNLMFTIYFVVLLVLH